VQHPLAVTGLNEVVNVIRGVTYQFQRIGLGLFSHVVHDVPVVYPRRHQGEFFILHRGPD
jgi:hypothetical protein